MPSAAPSAPFRLPDQPVALDVMAKYFRAFGDPTRLRIMQLLATAEMSVGELVAATGQSQPKVSNHLSCLRWCGFVRSRREHRCVYYAIAEHPDQTQVSVAPRFRRVGGPGLEPGTSCL